MMFWCQKCAVKRSLFRIGLPTRRLSRRGYARNKTDGLQIGPGQGPSLKERCINRLSRQVLVHTFGGLPPKVTMGDDVASQQVSC